MPPVITGVSVSHGVAGTAVTITGTGLGAITGVTFGETSAGFTVISSTTIAATVPDIHVAADAVSVTDGTAGSSYPFTVLFASEWLHPAARSDVAAVVTSDHLNAVQTFGAENDSDAAAAIVDHDNPNSLLSHGLILDGAVLGGWRYGTGLNVQFFGNPLVSLWYDYQQWEGNVGWSISDLEVIDDTTVYSDPDYFSTEFDTTNWQTAVSAVHPVITVMPHLLGANVGDLPSSSLRISKGGAGGYWISRHQTGETFRPCLDDVETDFGYASRAYSAGAGPVDLGALDPSTFFVSGGTKVNAIVGYIDRQQGAAPLVATENAQDYVAWTMDSFVTTITFTPLPVRHLFTQPRGVPPLRQRQRRTGLGAAYGAPLRQRGTLGDEHPPLRQRRTL